VLGNKIIFQWISIENGEEIHCLFWSMGWYFSPLILASFIKCWGVGWLAL
jgi:hypothetical protein